MQIRAVERWLDDGWSPWGIAYGVVALVATVVSVYGYVSHPHHPGAVWWLLAAVGLVAVWALLEAMRWRIRYKRLLASKSAQKEAQPTSKPADPVWTLLTAQAQKRTETVKALRQLIADGRALQSRIKTISQDQKYVPASVGPDIAKWENDVCDALMGYPKILAVFEDKISLLHNVSGLGEIYPSSAIIIIEDGLGHLRNTIKIISRPVRTAAE